MTRRTASGVRLLEAVILLFLSAAVGRGATFLVTNTNDSGPGSLRQAILEANFLGGPDSIAFQIPGPGPYVIAPLSQLPSTSGPTIVDGQTQPGFSSGNRVQLSGASAGPGVDGLVITGPTCVVIGLVIRGFQRNGVVLQGGGGSILLDNRIGTDLAGLAAAGNGGSGVFIQDSPNNRIGPSSAGELRNVISGNREGIAIFGTTSDSNLVVGNFIGPNVDGTAALGNVSHGVMVYGGSGNVISSTSSTQVISGNDGDGIFISGLSGSTGSTGSTFVAGNRIGTDVTGTVDLGNGGSGVFIRESSFNQVGLGNLISGNDVDGVLLLSGATNNAVGGNFIGTNASGTAALGNSGDGVSLYGVPLFGVFTGVDGNRIGGIGSGEGNLISGNGKSGVRIRGGVNRASGNLVLGNRIGSNHAETTALPNLEHGIWIDAATDNVVGGATAAHSNVVFGNFLHGVFLTHASTTGNSILGNRIGANVLTGVSVQAGTRNRILANSVFSNGLLGIDLAGDLVTPNDPLDSDTGANLLQNSPVITLATGTGGQTQVQGILHSAPQTTFHLEFFSSPDCDASGHGEGRVFLGSLSATTDAAGNAAFAGAFSTATPLGHFVTSTATDPDGNTSEFSACAGLSASYYTLAPCRVVDTRSPGGSPLTAGESRVFAVGGSCGLPPAPRAIAINVTAVDATAPGHLSVVPAGTSPTVSTLNYRATQPRANNAIVTLGPSGDLTVSCSQPGGTVHVLIDVVGYFE